MTRMTGPDCVVMCNLINTYIHTYIHTTYILIIFLILFYEGLEEFNYRKTKIQSPGHHNSFHKINLKQLLFLAKF